MVGGGGEGQTRLKLQWMYGNFANFEPFYSATPLTVATQQTFTFDNYV